MLRNLILIHIYITNITRAIVGQNPEEIFFLIYRIKPQSSIRNFLSMCLIT